MVEEVRHSAAEEEDAIHALFGSMQDRLAERKALLLQAVQSQYEEKDKAFKEQLSHLATLLPTLQVHLVICSSFLSLANKAEFLDLGYAGRGLRPQGADGAPLPLPSRKDVGVTRPKAHAAPVHQHQGAAGGGREHALRRALPPL
uniref:Isoform 3 of RING finger protein 207 n=1 Tax=Homo sapiens TaxID=9606 RepID=Q6ZRF8-3